MWNMPVIYCEKQEGFRVGTLTGNESPRESDWSDFLTVLFINHYIPYLMTLE